MRKAICFLLPLALVVLAASSCGSLAVTPATDAVSLARRGLRSALALKVEVPRAGGLGTRESYGSGVIVDGPGRRAVTALHVVAGSRAFKAVRQDGTELGCAVSFRDADHDVAVLKLAGEGTLQGLTLAEDAPRPGEPVLVIGCPMGFCHSVSAGLVSAVGRKITLPGGPTDLAVFQTDAAINPGSSGGLVLNARGELLGLVVALREGAPGIGFAVPAEAVRAALKERSDD